MYDNLKWMTVPGHPNYEVSDSGHLRNASNKNWYSLTKSKDGYLKTNLYTDGAVKHVLMHRVVLAAFIGPSDQQVNHKNGIKDDNRLENLEYCTQSENIKHAFKYGLYTRKGEQNPGAKLTWEKVDEIRGYANLKSSYYTQKKLAEMYGVSKTAISAIVSGKKWKEESRDKAKKN